MRIGYVKVSLCLFMIQYLEVLSTESCNAPRIERGYRGYRGYRFTNDVYIVLGFSKDLFKIYERKLSLARIFHCPKREKVHG